MDLFSLLQKIFDDVNITSKYKFHLSREECIPTLLPTCNKAEMNIIYPENTVVFLILSNYANPIIKSSFYLQNILAKNHFYNEAIPVINECISCVENEFNIIEDSLNIPDIIFQSLYLLFHEFGHCILSKEKELSEIYSNYVKSILSRYYNPETSQTLINIQMSTLPDWIKDSFKEIDFNLGESITSSIDKSQNLFLISSNFEELICDTYSIMTLFPVLEEIQIINLSKVALLSNNLFRMINDMGTFLYYSNYVLKDSRIPNLITPVTGMRIMVIYDAIYSVISQHYPKSLKHFEKLNGTHKVDITELLFDSDNLHRVRGILKNGSNQNALDSDKRKYLSLLKYLYQLFS